MLVFMLGVLNSTSYSEITKYTDKSGIVHIETSKNSNNSFSKTKRLAGYNYMPTLEGMLDLNTYADLIEKHAKTQKLDPNLIRAVIKVESNFQRFAKSNKNAAGLMQLLPSTAALYKVYDIWDPEKNIKAGTQHLKYLIDRYKGNIKYALAAYNAGETAVDVYNGIPPYRETTDYVDKVVRYYEFYSNKKLDSESKTLRTPFSAKVKSKKINNVLYITNVKR